jgi:Fe2+ transport system protein B
MPTTNLLYRLPNNTTGGMDQIVVDTVTALPSFTPLLLVFVFGVVAIGGIFRQRLRTGTADYAMWVSLASISTLIISLIMSVISGIVRLDQLVIVLAVTILSAVWLFLDRKNTEL